MVVRLKKDDPSDAARFARHDQKIQLGRSRRPSEARKRARGPVVIASSLSLENEAARL
jgi:hypothetical protein